MLIERGNFWKLHGLWLMATALIAAGALVWCIVSAGKSHRWPGGGSFPGLVTGTLAAAIFLLELALVAKKTRILRTARWSLSAQTWMKAHIWLGLLTVPLVVMHSGGSLGGTLTTLLMALFAIVIASGLWGLALQNLLPRLLLEGVPAETVYSQIDAVGRQYADEARRLVVLHCGAEGDELTAAEGGQAADAPQSGRIRGAPRQVGPLVTRSPHPARELPQARAAPAVREALRRDIVPFLATGANEAGLLGSRPRNRWYFDDLQLRVAPELRGLVGKLEDLCERRRQLNVQRRLHLWLHNWLWLHLPLSLALVVLLVGHVISALQFG